MQLDIARLHIARELALLREQGFNLAADESVISFLIKRGFHQRLGARPRRDAVEKYLRRAVADAMLVEVSLHRGASLSCAAMSCCCVRCRSLRRAMCSLDELVSDARGQRRHFQSD